MKKNILNFKKNSNNDNKNLSYINYSKRFKENQNIGKEVNHLKERNIVMNEEKHNDNNETRTYYLHEEFVIDKTNETIKFIRNIKKLILFECGSDDILNEPIINSTVHERNTNLDISYSVYDKENLCEAYKDKIICRNISKDFYKIKLYKNICFEHNCIRDSYEKIIENFQYYITQFDNKTTKNCNPKNYPQEIINEEERIICFCTSNNIEYCFHEDVHFFNCIKYQKKQQSKDKEKLISIINSLYENYNCKCHYHKLPDILKNLIISESSIKEAYDLFDIIYKSSCSSTHSGSSHTYKLKYENEFNENKNPTDNINQKKRF
ncbi:hypothetical protein PIROE2DRAFT_64793 [Piromyces sp. E2]|nr:hypothetical protein PIROE2DRAFT_64793 [Piromyces sp. E2]|eukprot:OUM57809.1 hypothetical protein PIROE2DRAFT_64793 [Piromyces sp. E2]